MTAQSALALTSGATPNLITIPANPAIDLTLQGLHLIEASAGTGKTWTLATLMVRLIVEGGFFTRQIIATTFTRAAAAELKARIRKSFENYRSVLTQAIDAPDITLQQSVERQDWLAVHLLQTLNIDQQGHAQKLLQLALDTFDELFVGTLDSFCQKLTSEFAFDSGQYESLQISEKDTELCYQVLHQSLRKWYSQQSPRLIELLVAAGQYKDVAHFQDNIQQVLNFLSAPIEQVEVPQFDWQTYDDVHQAICDINSDAQKQTLASFNEFLHEGGTHYQHLHGSRAFKKHGNLLTSLINSISSHSVSYLLTLDEHEKFATLLDAFLDIDAQFKTKEENRAALAEFYKLPQLAAIQACAKARQQLNQQLEQTAKYINYYLSLKIREALPQLLADQGETTFSQQMRNLSQALQNDPEHALAQHIQHRYPVALVDEFQDTNSDQDQIIAQIWRNARPQSKNCLILVGDPKQAIYGFRGGDMLTYKKARADVLSKQGKQHFLQFNHRSIAPLVKAVDTLLQRRLDLGEGIEYAPVDAAGHNQTQLCWQTDQQTIAVNPQPLRWLAVTAQKTNLQQIAWQIIQLLSASASGKLYWQSQPSQLAVQPTVQPLQPQDIAVLCRTNSQLDVIEAILLQAKIPVCRSARINVLASSMATEVAALMQLMLNPLHEGYLRRVLSGLLVGHTLADLLVLDQNPDELARLQGLFIQLAEQWHQFGFLSAWQSFSRRFDVWRQLATVENAERHIVNLRHVVELVHQRAQTLSGQHYLLSWLMQQMQHPSQRDSELERRLSGAQGVQLMTIHKSKGLEFPIVFVGSLDKGKTDSIKLAFYEQDQQRMLSFDTKNEAYAAAHRARESAELKRLMYVALTRASACLYVVAPPLPELDAKGNLKPAKGLLYHWLPTVQHEWVCANSKIEDELTECPAFVYSQHDTLPQLDARPLPMQRPHAWGLTSFSQLSRYQKFTPSTPASTDQPLNTVNTAAAISSAASLATSLVPSTNSLSNSHALDELNQASVPQSIIEQVGAAALTSESSTADRMLYVDEPDAMFESDISGQHTALLPLNQSTVQNISPQPTVVEDFCFAFPRGTQAGECLHSILERIHPQQPQYWQDIFSNHLQQFAINLEVLAEKNPVLTLDNMQLWFNDILHAHLPDGATLASLNSQIHEFEFHLALTPQQLDTQAIYQLMQQFDLPVSTLNPVMNARYLHGYIDLVYEHNNKYYVADYKSNSLKIAGQPDCVENYQPAAMQNNMSEAGYWLQAVLYQVALHRYLRLRLVDYQPAQHLGGVVYLYLRGMRAGDAQTGILHWPVNMQLINQLDEILGQHDGAV